MEYDLILRIFIAALLGGLIGLEREYRAKEAGFRTHFLVALGSALFMIVSAYGFSDVQMDGMTSRWDVSRTSLTLGPTCFGMSALHGSSCT